MSAALIQPEIKSIEGTLHVVLAGEYDEHYRLVFAEALATVEEAASDGRKVLVDLSRLDLLCACGIGWLCKLNSIAQAGDLIIIAPGKSRAYRAFLITGLADRLPVYTKRPVIN